MSHPDMTEAEVREFFHRRSYPTELINERLRTAQRKLEEKRFQSPTKPVKSNSRR
jgi:hypothetical protein